MATGYFDLIEMLFGWRVHPVPTHPTSVSVSAAGPASTEVEVVGPASKTVTVAGATSAAITEAS